MEELPREKLLKYGMDSLEDYEVLSLLIGSGTKTLNVFELSKKIIDELVSLENIENLDIKDLMNFEGIGVSKASIILSSFELSRRIEKRKKIRAEIRNSKDIFLSVYNSYIGQKCEKLTVIFLDLSSKIISRVEYNGFNYMHVDVDTNEILRKCLILKAKGIALIHNHPSGNISPSDEDILFTKMVEEKLKSFSLLLIDHIIIYESSFYSIIYQKKYKMNKPKKSQK